MTNTDYWFVRCTNAEGTLGLLHEGTIYSTKTPPFKYMYKIEEVGHFWGRDRFVSVKIPDISSITSLLQR